MTNGDQSDLRAWRRWRAVGEVRYIHGDAQDDAIAVLDLKGQGLSKRAVLDRYSEGASIKRVARIDDGNSRDVVLTIHAARGIKKIPRSFDGLTGLVQECFGQGPLTGHLFLFINRRRDWIKILYFDRDGLAIWYKRLEAGSFEMSHTDEPTALNFSRRDSP